MRRLVHQQNTIQQNVDSMQQKAQELQAEAERCRELQKSGNAEVRHPSTVLELCMNHSVHFGQGCKGLHASSCKEATSRVGELH